MTEQEAKGFEEFIGRMLDGKTEWRLGCDHPDHCIHKFVHYQSTGKELTCKKCEKIACMFNMNKDCWRTQCLNKPLYLPDCNECVWINLTEAQQEVTRRPHVCELYHKYLKHRANTRDHDDFINPCKECEKDEYGMFRRRDEQGERHG